MDTFLMVIRINPCGNAGRGGPRGTYTDLINIGDIRKLSALHATGVRA